MRRTRFIHPLAAVAVALFVVSLSWADVVVPNGNATVEGARSNAFPWTAIGTPAMRYQQVHASSQFPAATILEGMRYRPEGPGGRGSGTAFSRFYPMVEITLSTTSAAPGALSTTFASNIGPDVTTVFSGPLTLSSANTGPGPRDFDVEILFSTMFNYDPTLGNLLVDITISPGATGTTSQLDAVDTGSVSSRAYASSPTATSGFADNGALVTQFVEFCPDTTKPVATCAVQRAVLWPPFGGLYPVGLTINVLDVDPAPAIEVTVYSDEPNGLPPYAPDALDLFGAWRLRAERDGTSTGNGRIYLVVVKATDQCGNEGLGCCTTVVPRFPTVFHITQVLMEAAAARTACINSGTGDPGGLVQVSP